VIKKLNQFVTFLLGLKVLSWVAPDTNRFIKGILSTLAVILLTIYFQNEYLNWAEASDSKNYLTLSYVLKNLIILFSIIYLFFYLKKSAKKVHKKIPGEEKIYTKKSDEDYFDRFRNKEKLKTKAERILEKDGKK